jgi:hypothetical protein
MTENARGYFHPGYAGALREFGEPRELPCCGGWILARHIRDTPYKDAMGCYPLFACQDWSRLHEDLAEVGKDLVTLGLVTDPFAVVDLSYLERHFQIVTPFKSHYVADLSSKPEHFVNKHHRYYARKSLREIAVEICEEPLRYLDEWYVLYEQLIHRHQILGIRAFSKDSFRQQLQVPGAVIAVGKLGEQVVGGLIVIIQGDVSYSHLAASSVAGYNCSASYGIYWTIINYLKKHCVRFFDIGATAGTKGDVKDGLELFKAGWSNETRMVYFCGKIFDSSKYKDICLSTGKDATDYFPAYRVGEYK